MKHSLHDLSVIWNSKRFSRIESSNAVQHVLEQFKVFDFKRGESLLKSKFIITSSTYRANYKNFKIILDLINSGWFEKNNISIFLTHVPESHINEIKNLEFVYFVNGRIDNRTLAYLYSKSQLAMHTSFFEGGVNVAPFSEAVSVGTPCIAARSRATEEAKLSDQWLFDGDNLLSLIHRLDSTFCNPITILTDQIKYYEEYEKFHNSIELKNSWKKLFQMG
jgi:glycosyltransferase involved in cell wall biosynthesis